MRQCVRGEKEPSSPLVTLTTLPNQLVVLRIEFHAKPLFDLQHDPMFLFAKVELVIRIGLKETLGVLDPVLHYFRMRALESAQS